MHRLLFVVVLLTGLCCGELRAQSTHASVTGYITDPTKAVIVGAKVIVINVGTNIRYEATTNSAGSYDVTNLPAGPYRIEVEKPGFKTVVKSDVILHVQDTAAINFEMALGSASEIVTVTAGGLVVNTTDATVSTVVDRQFAENLPMNGRSFQTLIELTPGVVVVPSNPEDDGQFSINGQRATSNYWMVDGVSANIGVSSGVNPGNGIGGTLGSFSTLGGTNSLVSVDAMQEFRIQTSTYAPEFGRTPGGQISIVTRSGTNQFHGTAFDYLRNDIFDANNWFNTSVTPALSKAEERQNDFGGTLSGPIFKDHTFFFFSYEGFRLRLPQTTLSSVPCDSTCQVFGNARANPPNPAMQPYLNAYPLPNGQEVFTPCTPNVNGCPASGQRPTGMAQLNANYSNPATLDAYSLRVDHRVGSKIAVFGRYNYSPSEIAQRGVIGTAALSVVEKSRITTQTGTAGATWSVSPTVTNDVRFNYSRTDGSSNFSLDNFGGAVPLGTLPFPSSFTVRNGQFIVFVFSLTGGRSLHVGQQAENLQRQINVVDNASVQRGSHALKFGVDFRRLSPQVNLLQYEQFANFTTVSAFENGNGNGRVFSGAPVTFAFHNLGIFAQDTWRVGPRLTLTYGLRWDVDFAPSSLSGPSIPAVTGYNLADLSSLAVAPAGTSSFKTTYENVAPRLGLAYQLSQSQTWETVLRGGFGVFYDLVSSETGTSLGGSHPPFGNSTPVSGPFPFASSTIGAPAIPPTGTLSNLYAFNPGLKLPYTLEWNVALEQALGREQTISVTYLAAAGRRLIQTSSFVFPPTNLNIEFANLVDNLATSDYEGLQVQFQRRLSHGLQALLSYTWSHSIDNASAGSLFSTSNSGLPGDPNSNRASSDFDTRNAFSAALTYDIPSPRVNSVAKAILRGWSLQNVILARSAPPVDVSDGSFQGSSFNSGIAPDIRPDLVPGQPLYVQGSQYPGGRAFNPAAFTDPPADPNTGNPARNGNVPRNFLRGFGATQWDFAVHRDFPIRESLHLQFRAEMFNVLNHPNFAPPSGIFGLGGFGVSTQLLGQSLNSGNLGGGGLSQLYQIGAPRSMQFALKLVF